jgi:two-component system, NarL family, response regulator NreC
MNQKITILIVDDHPIVREGLKLLLNKQQDFSVVGESADGPDAIAKTRLFKPIIVLMDVSMPGMSGVEATAQICKKFEYTKVIALTMIEESGYVGKMIEAGASGYLLKDASGEEIIKAIRRVAQGEKYFSKKVYELIGQYLSNSAATAAEHADDRFDTLTKREKEILKMISAGMTSQDIAKKLLLSPRTIETHRANLMHKLNIHSTAALIRFAFDHNLVDTNES